MFGKVKELAELFLFRKKWRKKNACNKTIAANMFDMDQVTVGKYTYGAIRVLNYGNGQQLKIGNFCSIAGETMFILNADHYVDTISTYPFLVQMGLEGIAREGVSKGDIVVDDDVWIGYRSTILSGVHIGQGAVVAAGAVVAKDVPPYAIVGGVPAKVIKYRFPPEIIEELMRVDYSKLTEQDVASHTKELYEKLTAKEQLAWLPKKTQ